MPVWVQDISANILKLLQMYQGSPYRRPLLLALFCNDILYCNIILLRCTALQINILHCNALPATVWTVQQTTELHCKTLHIAALHSNTFSHTALNCHELQITKLLFTAICCTTIHCNTLHYIPLLYTALCHTMGSSILLLLFFFYFYFFYFFFFFSKSDDFEYFFSEYPAFSTLPNACQWLSAIGWSFYTSLSAFVCIFQLFPSPFVR